MAPPPQPGRKSPGGPELGQEAAGSPAAHNCLWRLPATCCYSLDWLLPPATGRLEPIASDAGPRGSPLAPGEKACGLSSCGRGVGGRGLSPCKEWVLLHLSLRALLERTLARGRGRMWPWAASASFRATMRVAELGDDPTGEPRLGSGGSAPGSGRGGGVSRREPRAGRSLRKGGGSRVAPPPPEPAGPAQALPRRLGRAAAAAGLSASPGPPRLRIVFSPLRIEGAPWTRPLPDDRQLPVLLSSPCGPVSPAPARPGLAPAPPAPRPLPARPRGPRASFNFPPRLLFCILFLGLVSFSLSPFCCLFFFTARVQMAVI